MFMYRIWCKWCAVDNDLEGCFWGGSEMSGDTYNSIEEAAAAAKERAGGDDRAWQYDVVEVNEDGEIIRQADTMWLIPYVGPDGRSLKNW